MDYAVCTAGRAVAALAVFPNPPLISTDCTLLFELLGARSARLPLPRNGFQQIVAAPPISDSQLVHHACNQKIPGT